jgi:type II secretory pathway pseudopilin PulG
MRSPFIQHRSARRRRERGYVLLTLLLTVSLMTIAALAVLPDMIFELKRDNENEMIHRGVQYTRAIRAYYRKFGRYPTRLEDLDNTNNLKYLRKHYKDPLTGKDFKLLHFGDPGLTLGGSIGGGVIPGATAVGAMNGNGANGSAFGSSNGSSFGGSSGSSFGGGGSSFGSNGSSFGGSGFGSSGAGSSGVNSNGVFSPSSSFGGGSNSGFGGSSSSFGSNSNSQPNSGQPGSSGTPAGTDASQPGTQVAEGGPQTADAGSSGQPPIGGGPIVGVASISKKTTIREFNKKKKYNEWQFIYDPMADRGGLIKTPYQPPLQGMAGSLQPGQNGQPGTAGANGSPFGNPGSNAAGQSPFGQSSSFGSGFGSGQSGSGQSSFGQPSSGFGNNPGGSNPAPSNPQQQ